MAQINNALSTYTENPMGLTLEGWGETLRVEDCDSDLVDYMNRWYTDEETELACVAFVYIPHYFDVLEENGGKSPAMDDAEPEMEDYELDENTDADELISAMQDDYTDAAHAIEEFESGVKPIMEEARAKGASFVIFRLA